jgi:hypothetical protein
MKESQKIGELQRGNIKIGEQTRRKIKNNKKIHQSDRRCPSHTV